MKVDKGYHGTIQNTGTQVVKAPMQHTKPKMGVVRQGSDLRSNKQK